MAVLHPKELIFPHQLCTYLVRECLRNGQSISILNVELPTYMSVLHLKELIFPHQSDDSNVCTYLVGECLRNYFKKQLRISYCLLIMNLWEWLDCETANMHMIKSKPVPPEVLSTTGVDNMLPWSHREVLWMDMRTHPINMPVLLF